MSGSILLIFVLVFFVLPICLWLLGFRGEDNDD